MVPKLIFSRCIAVYSPPDPLELFPVFEAEKCGNYKGYIATGIKRGIATKCKALNRLTVFSPCSLTGLVPCSLVSDEYVRKCCRLSCKTSGAVVLYSSQDYSRATKASRHRFSAGFAHSFRMWENVADVAVSRHVVFSGSSRLPRSCITPRLHPHLISSSSALKISLLSAAEKPLNTLCLSPNSAGRCCWSAGFLGISRFPLPFHSGAAAYPPRFILIGSQDLNLFTSSHSRTGCWGTLEHGRIVGLSERVAGRSTELPVTWGVKYRWCICSGEDGKLLEPVHLNPCCWRLRLLDVSAAAVPSTHLERSTTGWRLAYIGELFDVSPYCLLTTVCWNHWCPDSPPGCVARFTRASSNGSFTPQQCACRATVFKSARFTVNGLYRHERLRWYHEIVSWRSEWRVVVFSDESRLCHGQSIAHVRIRRRKGERDNPSCIRTHNSGSTPGFNGARGREQYGRVVHFATSNLPSARLDSLQEPIFLHDNSRCHAAMATQRTLHGVIMLYHGLLALQISALSSTCAICALSSMCEAPGIQRTWNAVPQRDIQPPECKGEGNGRSLRKPAEQRHRPARFPLGKIREWTGRGLSPNYVARGPYLLEFLTASRRQYCETLLTDTPLRVSLCLSYCDSPELGDVCSFPRLKTQSAVWEAHGNHIRVFLRESGFLLSGSGAALSKAMSAVAVAGPVFTLTSFANIEDDCFLWIYLTVPVTVPYLELGSEERGNDKGDISTHIKCLIASKRKALSWRAVFSSHCLYLWDFQRRHSIVSTKASLRCKGADNAVLVEPLHHRGPKRATRHKQRSPLVLRKVL
ncbi:hypothetical protein PR048_023963 [Dryococelus australis]|uniref:Uncharacterized protein n=1 Tax=Dryococelus australis TaxID=614101 RepID=A0ABQ9GVJ4_9NEOP|nr:hypothetical protein PR048_023963 [Dryococelus australis]